MLRFIGLPGTPDPYVTIQRWDQLTARLFETANQWSQANGKTVDINAIDNGTHSPTTFHGRSLAWDLDVDGDHINNLSSLAAWLKMLLPPPYQVVLEHTHVHVEWDTGMGR